jgi:hypothetical protein
LSLSEGFGGGILVAYYSTATITQNTIADNKTLAGGGIFCAYSSDVTVFGNTITANVARSPIGGGGGGLVCFENCEVTITNTIFWNNDADTGKELYISHEVDPSTLTISYSDVEGAQLLVYLEPGSVLNWGSGMIDENPLFVLPDKMDYRLLWDSSCIDTGHPDYLDPDGALCDIGAHCFNQDDYLTLYVTPDRSLISSGTQTGVTYTLINRWENPEPFWLLTQAILPGGGTLIVDGPANHAMPAEGTVQVHMTHNIPAWFPTGVSECWSRIGMPPSTLYDEDLFEFLVTE